MKNVNANLEYLMSILNKFTTADKLVLGKANEDDELWQAVQKQCDGKSSGVKWHTYMRMYKAMHGLKEVLEDAGLK